MRCRARVDMDDEGSILFIKDKYYEYLYHKYDPKYDENGCYKIICENGYEFSLRPEIFLSAFILTQEDRELKLGEILS